MDTKTNLLNHALDGFSRMSYEGCGVQEICESAGITKPTLYHHFGSKYGLLRDVVNWMMRPLLANLEHAWPYKGDLPMTLQSITAAFFRFAELHPISFRYYLSLHLAPKNSDSRRAVEVINRDVTQGVTDVFRAASRDHGNMRERHLMLAAGYLGMVNTFGALITEGSMKMSEQLVHKAVHQFSHGIYS